MKRPGYPRPGHAFTPTVDEAAITAMAITGDDIEPVVATLIVDHVSSLPYRRNLQPPGWRRCSVRFEAEQPLED